ncbi:replication protein [Bacillus sp. MMSF_3328]|uniref:replication protein n=1 Tax=Bacillus sp. MMSF_3328 TaxID=3047080 RepID=UPI00273D7927|nr:replication protein [Bacillus sp. MMSF_3328]
MASPQLKNGFTRIANEILLQIMRVNLNGTQFRIVMAIWRYTYGYKGRKEYEMPISLIASLINASRSQVNRELSDLIERKIISSNGIGPSGGRILGFNKDYEKWDSETSGAPAATKKAPAPKQPKKPAKPLKYDEENSYYKMAVYFHKRVAATAKESGVEHLIKRANLQTWADDFRKLIEIDRVTKKKAKEVMDWVTKDDFWKTNVLSARKLREKFSELAIKMTASQKPKQRQQAPLQQPDPRDKEIAFQRWIDEGNEPDAFDWSK